MNKEGPSGGRRRESHSSVTLAERIWSQLERFAADYTLPLEHPPSPAVVVAYLACREDGSWGPGKTAKPLKYNTLQAYRDSIVAYCRLQGWDTSALEDSDALTAYVANCRLRLPAERVASSGARPLPQASPAGLLEHIDALVEKGEVSKLWASRWQALVVLGCETGMRISELIRLELGWISVAEDRLTITIPHGKYQTEPRKVHVPTEPAGRYMAAWLQRAADSLGDDTYRLPVVFPSVSRLPPNPPRQGASVAGLTLRDFPSLLAEATTKSVSGTPVADLPAGSNKKIEWRCGRCSTEWSTRVISRTARGAGCRNCRRAGKRLKDRAGNAVEILDTVGARLADPTFNPDATWEERYRRALKVQTDDDNATFKDLCRGAGIHPRDAFERVTTHSLRKTTGTSMANSGATSIEISRHLRHDNPRSSEPYIVERDLNWTSILRDIPGW